MPIVHLCKSSPHATGTIQDHPGIAIASPRSPSGIGRFVVTAVAIGSGNLRLIGWKVSEKGGSITRICDSGDQAGSVSRLAMVATLPPELVVTAVRTEKGNLKVIAWRLDTANNKFARVSDTRDFGGPVSLIRMARDGEHIIVGVSNAAGNLVLQNYGIQNFGNLLYTMNAAGTIKGKSAGAISQLALGPNFTAVRTADGNLKVIMWQAVAGGDFNRLGDSGQQGGPVSLVDAVSFNDLIITAVRDSGGNLKLITWRISDNGKTASMIGDSGAPPESVDLLACQYFPYDDTLNLSGGVPGTGIGRIFTAVRTSAKTLKIIGWQVETSGDITRLANSYDRPGSVDAISFADIGNGQYLTAVRDATDRELHLDVWQITAS